MYPEPYYVSTFVSTLIYICPVPETTGFRSSKESLKTEDGVNWK